MATFTIIGTGNMGQAIGGVLASGGADVTYVTREEVGRGALGDVVVLALPYPAIDSVVEAYGSQFDGKVVVDITNPLNFETFDSLVVPADGSAAAEIQKKLPNAKVVKAFNTTFAGTLSSKKIGELTTTVLIAGDDSDAKSTLASAVSAGGLNAVDAGSLKRARELEATGFLQLTLAAGEKVSWTGGFGLLN